MDRDAVTQNPDEARDFKHTSKALRFIRQSRIPNVQIVLKFPKSSDDVNLAILELLDKDQNKLAQKMPLPSDSASVPALDSDRENL